MLILIELRTSRPGKFPVLSDHRRLPDSQRLLQPVVCSPFNLALDLNQRHSVFVLEPQPVSSFASCDGSHQRSDRGPRNLFFFFH